MIKVTQGHMGKTQSNMTGVLVKRWNLDTEVMPGMSAHRGKTVWGQRK